MYTTITNIKIYNFCYTTLIIKYFINKLILSHTNKNMNNVFKKLKKKCTVCITML